MESFFSSLKIEQAANKVYRTRDDAKADVLDYPEPRMSREALRLPRGKRRHRLPTVPA
jgi:hypothetical protein